MTEHEKPTLGPDGFVTDEYVDSLIERSAEMGGAAVVVPNANGLEDALGESAYYTMPGDDGVRHFFLRWGERYAHVMVTP
ncbi:MAG TPA: hypothetical protein VFQ76_05940 [Longimicrobiaceae bacterium]|nr:hypothetical protein [Longimicrobiaceae bacterium]